jgi:hypothetical protein
MAKKNKLLNKIMSIPIKKGITFREVEALLVGLGYEKIEGSGSRVGFYNSEFDHLIDLHKPHPGNELKVYQVKKIQTKLKEIL